MVYAASQAFRQLHCVVNLKMRQSLLTCFCQNKFGWNRYCVQYYCSTCVCIRADHDTARRQKSYPNFSILRCRVLFSHNSPATTHRHCCICIPSWESKNSQRSITKSETKKCYRRVYADFDHGSSTASKWRDLFGTYLNSTCPYFLWEARSKLVKLIYNYKKW
jgi:hypothetical protein